MVEETEIWKHYKTRYSDIEISNFGNVRGVKWDSKEFNDDIIKIWRGRRRIGFKLIYRLVWEIFNGPVPKGYDVHHIDNNKLNDRLDNLTILPHSMHSTESNTGLKRPHSDEWKLNNSKRMKGNKIGINRIHINNGTISKMIYPEELEYYISQGYQRGRIYKRKNRNS